MDERTLQRSWLVQRLKRPIGENPVTMPHAFGGGMRNGGLTDDAVALLAGLFRFDYMGAAQYEFGAVPGALAMMAGDAADNRLEGGHITIVPGEVAGLPKWRKGEECPPPAGLSDVWYICREDWHGEVEARIRAWARSRYNSDDLRDPTHLAETLRPIIYPDGPSNPIHEVVGWLELDNGFMAFTDVKMWSGVLAMFQRLAGAEV